MVGACQLLSNTCYGARTISGRWVPVVVYHMLRVRTIGGRCVLAAGAAWLEEQIHHDRVIALPVHPTSQIDARF